MRILADENFPGDAVAALRERGHDVAWVRAYAPGSSDIQVLARAQAEGRILVTFDKDMELYLVQHGEAKSKAEDPQRSLTDQGGEEAQRLAAEGPPTSAPADSHARPHEPVQRAR